MIKAAGAKENSFPPKGTTNAGDREDPMCHIFAGQDPDDYEPETRRMRLNGQSTSIRLERSFWEIVDDIAASEGVTTPAFISKLHSEVLELRGETRNFTSLLRCACLTYLAEVRGQDENGEKLRRDAVLAFHHAAE